MPKVHFVKKARVSREAHGIKIGDSYFWWKTRMKGQKEGRIHYSKERPKPSQLTMSEFYSAVYAAQEAVEDADTADAADALRCAAQEIREAGEGCEERFNNMPEGLQQGESGQLLEARRDACETLADSLETAATEVEDILSEDDAEDREESINNIISNIDWTFE